MFSDVYARIQGPALDILSGMGPVLYVVLGIGLLLGLIEFVALMTDGEPDSGLGPSGGGAGGLMSRLGGSARAYFAGRRRQHGRTVGLPVNGKDIPVSARALVEDETPSGWRSGSASGWEPHPRYEDGTPIPSAGNFGQWVSDHD